MKKVRINIAYFMSQFMKNSKTAKIKNKSVVRGWWQAGNKEAKGSLLR